MRLLYLINLVKYFSLVIKDESNYQITFIFFLHFDKRRYMMKTKYFNCRHCKNRERGNLLIYLTKARGYLNRNSFVMMCGKSLRV